MTGGTKPLFREAFKIYDEHLVTLKREGLLDD
jgi:hypothetical protein